MSFEVEYEVGNTICGQDRDNPGSFTVSWSRNIGCYHYIVDPNRIDAPTGIRLEMENARIRGTGTEQGTRPIVQWNKRI